MIETRKGCYGLAALVQSAVMQDLFSKHIVLKQSESGLTPMP